MATEIQNGSYSSSPAKVIDGFNGDAVAPAWGFNNRGGYAVAIWATDANGNRAGGKTICPSGGQAVFLPPKMSTADSKCGINIQGEGSGNYDLFVLKTAG